MRLVVCGGAGYIGSHMCKMLAQTGHQLAVIDDLSIGHQAALQWGKFYQGSIGDAGFLSQVFAEFRPEAVFHFAARSLVADSVADPAGYYQNNVSASLTLIQQILATPGCALIFSSTAAIYGTPQAARINENHPTVPINPYGRSKLIVENILSDYWTAYQLPTMTFRYFNAAGADPSGLIGEAHRPETHLIPLALEALLARSSPPRVFGSDYPTPDGTCIRDYIHVNDLCSAHLAGLNYLRAHPGKYHFNLGNGAGFSVREVLSTIEQVTGLKTGHTYVERRAGDPPQLVADATQAAALLGWTPAIPKLSDIIESAWKWHRLRKY